MSNLEEERANSFLFYKTHWMHHLVELKTYLHKDLNPENYERMLTKCLARL